MTRRQICRLVGEFACHLPLVLSAVLVLTPFIWMLSLSLKSPGEVFQQHFQLLPQHFYAVHNYARALTAVPFLRFLLNGVVVCTMILALQLLTGIPCAYALAKFKFKGRRLLFLCIIAGLLIPNQVLAIPLFVVLNKLDLLDTYGALVLPSCVSPFAIFLLRQFFLTLPDDLVYAARLDGLGEFSIVWRIALPYALPAVAAFAIYSVVAHWNDLYWPLIVIKSERLATPPLGIAFFRNDEAGGDFGPLMAGAVMTTAPLILAFLVAQRRFIEGVAPSRYAFKIR